ncbi:MAG: hypothetical protein M3N43_03270 [Actinomycetota bacterium]|nr:hypothetical protein [Actinomycetota bacterium]
MALCVQLDVEQKLQWDITAEPDSVVAALIADAQALIEAEVGRTLESATRAETFDGGRWSMFLTYWPVTAVATVTEDGTALTVNTDYKWYPNGKLIRVSGGHQIYWQTGEMQSVAVGYTGGFIAGTTREHLGSLCAEVVARAFRKGADNAAIPSGAVGQIQSVSLAGSDSVTYATAEGSATGGGVNQFIYLEDDERRQLALPKYRRPRFGFA